MTSNEPSICALAYMVAIDYQYIVTIVSYNKEMNKSYSILFSMWTDLFLNNMKD